MAEMFLNPEYHVRYYYRINAGDYVATRLISVVDLKQAKRIAEEIRSGGKAIGNIEITKSTRRIVVEVTVLESFPSLPVQKS